MDIGLSGIHTYGTCLRMCSTDRGANAHISAMRGWCQEQEKRRDTEAGINAHVVKPVGHASLLAVLQSGIPVSGAHMIPGMDVGGSLF